jgi:hypothetical protein
MSETLPKRSGGRNSPQFILAVRRIDIPILLVEVLSTTERLHNALKEADSANAGSEASCGSFNEA